MSEDKKRGTGKQPQTGTREDCGRFILRRSNTPTHMPNRERAVYAGNRECSENKGGLGERFEGSTELQPNRATVYARYRVFLVEQGGLGERLQKIGTKRRTTLKYTVRHQHSDSVIQRGV